MTNKKNKIIKPVELPTIIPLSLEVDVSSEKEKRKKVTLDSDISEWGVPTFAKYFEYLYQTKFRSPYIINKADLAQMKRLLSVKEKPVIREYMEKFIELDYFPAKTLKIFCSSYTQVALDSYFRDGSLPYSNNKNEPKELDGWGDQLKNMFGGEGS